MRRSPNLDRPLTRTIGLADTSGQFSVLTRHIPGESEPAWRPKPGLAVGTVHFRFSSLGSALVYTTTSFWFARVRAV